MASVASGDRELRTALAESRQLFLAVGVFSIFVNLLMLTGPIFMLQVYDRVLTSRSEATLVTLVMITAFLFLMMGVLDYARGRVMARAGARLQERLDARVLKAILSRSIAPDERSRPATGASDVQVIQRFFASTGPFAFFDVPWTPVFLCVLFIFHWMLGVLAVFSGCLLLLLALLNQARTGKLQAEVSEAMAHSTHFIDQMRTGSETVQGLGMQDAVVEQSGHLRSKALQSSIAAADRSGFFGVTAKTLRLFLQSMMLGLGAALAIQGQVTFGIIIAASILLGRALAPIDQAVGQWPLLQRVLTSRRSLVKLLEETPREKPRTTLPAPRAILNVSGLTVLAPGAKLPAVRGASLHLNPGQALGIAGPSASGKSTLARAMAGVYRPLGGSVRLDGAELEQYGTSLGHHVGYLPQEVALFEGTVAENIARLASDAKDEDIVEAAKRTGAHNMILKLPGGYDLQVSAGGAALSGGQRQRIGLARAFYRAPVIIVLDEPDSHLDAEGTLALANAVKGHKERGGAAVIVAHRHGAFAQCDQVYIMEGGRPVPAAKPRRQPTRKTRPESAKPLAAVTSPQTAAATRKTKRPGLRTVPNRETQIAAAIARVVSARPARAAATDDQQTTDDRGLATIQQHGGT